MILLYGFLALVFAGIYFFPEIETRFLDKGRDLFSSEETDYNDSIVDLSSNTTQDFSEVKPDIPGNKALDSIFGSFRKEYDSIHRNYLYFDRKRKSNNWETGAYLYVVRNNNDIELRLKLNLITKKQFGLLSWKLFSDEKELSLEPTNPIVKENNKGQWRESCDMRVGGQVESFVLSIGSGRKNSLWFLSDKNDLKINLSNEQKESILRVYNAYNQGVESMLKS